MNEKERREARGTAVVQSFAGERRRWNARKTESSPMRRLHAVATPFATWQIGKVGVGGVGWWKALNTHRDTATRRTPGTDVGQKRKQ